VDGLFNKWKENEPYFDALKLLASLSKLFSDSGIPYLDYRLAENVFCRFFSAFNEARSCTAYDARINNLGIGIKTFILKNNCSNEKVAEFNKLKPELDLLNGIDLARKLGEFRNARIQFADSLYGTSHRIYHIVGRCRGLLRIFNSAYESIDLDRISVIRSDKRSLSFHDTRGEYVFNRSKSVLIKKFSADINDCVDIPVSLIDDPLDLLLKLFRKGNTVFAD